MQMVNSENLARMMRSKSVSDSIKVATKDTVKLSAAQERTIQYHQINMPLSSMQGLATRLSQINMPLSSMQGLATQLSQINMPLSSMQGLATQISPISTQLLVTQGINNILSKNNINDTLVRTSYLTDLIASLSAIHDFPNSLDVISGGCSCRTFLLEEKPFASSFTKLEQYRAVLNSSLLDKYVALLTKVQEVYTSPKDVREALCSDIEKSETILDKNSFLDICNECKIQISEKTRLFLSDKERVVTILELASKLIEVATEYGLLSVDTDTMSTIRHLIDFTVIALILCKK